MTTEQNNTEKKTLRDIFVKVDMYGTKTPTALARVLVWIATIFVGFSIIAFIASIHIVSTGEVGIVSKFGKVSRIDQPGFHFRAPFVEGVEMMETREQLFEFKKDDKNYPSLSVSTKDMQTITLDVSTQVSVSDPEKLYTAFRGQHENRIIRPRIREVAQTSISKFTIEEFVSRRVELSNMIAKDLKDDFAKYGLVVGNVSITDHDFSGNYELAIEEKKVAEQAVEKAKSEAERQRVEAENKVKLAEQAVRQKELEAQANSKLTESLTPEVLRKMELENERAKIDKWNGQMPQVSGSSSIVNLK